MEVLTRANYKRMKKWAKKVGLPDTWFDFRRERTNLLKMSNFTHTQIREVDEDDLKKQYRQIHLDLGHSENCANRQEWNGIGYCDEQCKQARIPKEVSPRES